MVIIVSLKFMFSGEVNQTYSVTYYLFKTLPHLRAVMNVWVKALTI